ncbi:MAG TPA: hypothetical protein VGL66_09695 [Caulobacteraceae bacterium]
MAAIEDAHADVELVVQHAVLRTTVTVDRSRSPFAPAGSGDPLPVEEGSNAARTFPGGIKSKDAADDVGLIFGDCEHARLAARSVDLVAVAEAARTPTCAHATDQTAPGFFP